MMRMQQHFVGRGGGLIRAPGGVSTLERPEVPRSLSLAGFEGQIAFSFYFRDYRWAYFWQGILQTSPVGNTDLSYKASLAVATGYLGKAKKDLDLESKATELSSVAVKAVQFTLDRGLKSDFPGLLAVITALGVYNACAYPPYYRLMNDLHLFSDKVYSMSWTTNFTICITMELR